MRKENSTDEDKEKGQKYLEEFRERKKPLFFCCSWLPLYYMTTHRFGLELFKLIFRVAFAIFLSRMTT